MTNLEETNPDDIISGHSHSFDSGIAVSLGMNAAVVYNHIIYWIKTNSSKKDYQTIEDKYWMYETMQQMSDYLGYLTVDEIKKAIGKLIDAGLLIKGCFNANPFDRTAWYTVHDQEIIKKIFTKVPYGTIRKCRTARSDSATGHDAECALAPSLYITDKQDTDIKKTTEQQQEGSVVGCSLDQGFSVPAEDEQSKVKTKAFNWFMQIGCDTLSAMYFVENYSIDDIHNASKYVQKQISKKKNKNEEIEDIIAYLRRTLENKWWIPKYS